MIAQEQEAVERRVALAGRRRGRLGADGAGAAVGATALNGAVA